MTAKRFIIRQWLNGCLDQAIARVETEANPATRRKLARLARYLTQRIARRIVRGKWN